MTNDLEARLTASLTATAGNVEPGPAPTFSWQHREQHSEQQPRRSGRRRAIGGAVVAAAAVAAAAVVATALSGAPSTGSTGTPVAEPSRSAPVRPPAPVTQSASALLLTAAHTRLRTGEPVLADGQFRYVKTTSTGSTDELWIPKDQRDVWLRRLDDSGGVTEWKGKCGDLYANAQDGPKGDPCDRAGSFDDPTPAFIAGLPDKAGALYRKLHEYAKGQLNPEKDHDVNSVVFSTVNNLLEGGMLTTKQSAEAYEVLSRIPGVTAVPGARNAEGTVGTGFRLTHSFGKQDDYTVTSTMIVDLRSAAYLGYAEDAPDQHYLTSVSEGVADTIGQPGN